MPKKMKPAWIVSWTENDTDYWIRTYDIEEAYDKYEKVLEMPDLMTAALSLQVESTD